MALVAPPLVHDGTNTSGTGSLTLTGSPPDQRQSLATAVSLGHAANTDEVEYAIIGVDANSDLDEFEVGIGTISDSGATLSRDTVAFNHLGTTAKVNLAGGKTYDVLITVGGAQLLKAANNLSDVDSVPTTRTNLDVPGLSTSNTYSAGQSVSTSTQTFLRGWGVYNSRAASTFNRSRISLTVDGVGKRDALVLSAGLSNVSGGSEESVIDFDGFSGGSIATLLTINGTSLEDTSGNKFDAFPSGTEMLFGTAPPTGWTRVNETGDEKLIKLAESGDTVGGTAGSTDFFDGSNFSTQSTGATTTGSHVLTLSEIPSHSHSITFELGADGSSLGPGFDFVTDITTAADSNTVNTSSSGSGNGHTHSVPNHTHTIATPSHRIYARATKD